MKFVHKILMWVLVSCKLEGTCFLQQIFKQNAHNSDLVCDGPLTLDLNLTKIFFCIPLMHNLILFIMLERLSVPQISSKFQQEQGDFHKKN